MNKQTKKDSSRQIASNKKAFHDYFIEDRFEAGLVLEGWEVKSLREGRVQLKESYVIVKNNELWLIGAHISPMSNVPAHLKPDPTRTRKLLLHAREMKKLRNAKDREGYTIVALDMHWTRGRAKLEIALAKGKKQHDKRQVSKQKDWKREKDRLLRNK